MRILFFKTGKLCIKSQRYYMLRLKHKVKYGYNFILKIGACDYFAGPSIERNHIKMKKAFFLYMLIILCIIPAFAIGQAPSPKRILIVYLSRTNNTGAIARIIHNYVGGTLVALELKKPYPENYRQTVEQVVYENERNYLPPLKTQIDSIQNYDVIFVGFPTWDMKMPPPMKSFLHTYNLSGITVIPFNTNAGYGVGSGFDTVNNYVQKVKYWKAFQLQAA